MHLENSMTIILQLLILLSVLWPTLQKTQPGNTMHNTIGLSYCTSYDVHCSLYSVQCTTLQCTLYIAYDPISTLSRTVYTVHCVHVRMCRRMFIYVHSTLHCTLYKYVVMCVGVLYAYFLVISLIFSPHLVSSNMRASHLCVYHVVCV